MSRWVVVFVVMSWAVAAAAFAADRFVDAPRPAGGTAGIDYGTPVAEDRRAVAELERRVAAYAAGCTTLSRRPSGYLGIAMLDSVGRVECTPTSSVGPDRLISAAYRSDDALAAAFDEWLAVNAGVYGACDGGSGRTGWATRDGVVRGRVLCTVSTTEARVVWTDTRDRSLTYVESARSGKDAPALGVVLEWWHDAVRPVTDESRAAERRLRAQVSKVIATRCTTDRAEGSPLALAAIHCSAPATRNGRTLGMDAYFERLPTAETLRRYISNLSAEVPYLPGDRTGDVCSRRALDRGPWGTPARGVVGRVVCFPLDEHLVLAWTDDTTLLYGYLRRKDTDLQALTRAWKALRKAGA